MGHDRCWRFREAASARLDGEPIGMSSSGLDHHLATCANCAGWMAEATRLTRMARLGTAEQPDLADQILAATVLPVRRVLRRRTWLRVALVVIGVVQLGLSLPSMFGDSIDMAMSIHATHEVAAWNCALAVALLATALRPRRAAGVLSVLATFVAVLTLLSIRDLASGAVTVGRLATHLGAVAGLVAVAALARVERALPPEPSTESGTSDTTGNPRLRGAA
jgi:predicted anti-sigma-YlaC factor YlaD